MCKEKDHPCQSVAEVRPNDNFSRKNLYDGVWAVDFAFAGFAVLAYPNVVKLLHVLHRLQPKVLPRRFNDDISMS